MKVQSIGVQATLSLRFFLSPAQRMLSSDSNSPTVKRLQVTDESLGRRFRQMLLRFAVEAYDLDLRRLCTGCTVDEESPDHSPVAAQEATRHSVRAVARLS